MSETAIPMPPSQAATSSDETTPSYEDLAGTLHRVSPKLVKARFLGNLAWWVAFLALCIGWHVLVVMLDWSPWWHLMAVPVYLLVAQSVAFTPRRARALGYATRENDVIFRSGILFRSLVVMPYGRVQDVEIEEGPIERRYGLSTVTLKSAGGMDSNVAIPGLDKAESERIRDLVTREAAAKMAAL